jgi:hypothetical protein
MPADTPKLRKASQPRFGAGGWRLSLAGISTRRQATRRTAAQAYAAELVALADSRERGQLVAGKVNPSVRIVRDTGLVKLRALKALNLDLEPLRDRVGRPPGPRPLRKVGSRLSVGGCPSRAGEFVGLRRRPPRFHSRRRRGHPKRVRDPGLV